MNCYSNTKKQEYVYVIGRNLYGEFGQYHSKPLKKLTLCQNHSNQTKIYCGDGYNIYTSHDEISNHKIKYWSVGNNQYGQCAVNHKNSLYGNCTIIKKPSKLQFASIKKICANVSGSATFWICHNNQVYGNGKNNRGQLGISGKRYEINSCVNKPTFISYLSNVVDIKSANKYSIALCMIDTYIIITYWCRMNIIKLIDEVINLIRNIHGVNSEIHAIKFEWANCGSGHTDTNCYYDKNKKGIWSKLDYFDHKEIIKIQTGKEFSLWLDVNGTVYSCGRNRYGQHGVSYSNHSRATNQIHPIVYFLTQKIRIKDIKCGYDHCLAVDNNGKMYSWGSNFLGQCGVDEYISDNPMLIKTLKHCNIQKIECGANHSYAMNDKMEHYMWGSNKYNECSILPGGDIIKLPHLINYVISKEIVRIYLGVESTIIIVFDSQYEKQKESANFEVKLAKIKTDYGRYFGICGKYNVYKSGGYIKLSDGYDDVLISVADLKSSGLYKLSKGDFVEFDIVVQNDGSRKAINITKAKQEIV
eukprot:461304_1